VEEVQNARTISSASATHEQRDVQICAVGVKTVDDGAKEANEEARSWSGRGESRREVSFSSSYLGLLLSLPAQRRLTPVVLMYTSLQLSQIKLSLLFDHLTRQAVLQSQRDEGER